MSEIIRSEHKEYYEKNQAAREALAGLQVARKHGFSASVPELIAGHEDMEIIDSLLPAVAQPRDVELLTMGQREHALAEIATRSLDETLVVIYDVTESQSMVPSNSIRGDN